jgi:hypothetical protein
MWWPEEPLDFPMDRGGGYYEVSLGSLSNSRDRELFENLNEVNTSISGSREMSGFNIVNLQTSTIINLFSPSSANARVFYFQRYAVTKKLPAIYRHTFYRKSGEIRYSCYEGGRFRS